MAEFHDTTGVSAQLTRIIKNARDRLVIISPYLRVNKQIKELLEDKDRMRINVWIIYGKNELRPEENNWLRSMNSTKTGYLQDLHAKCYMNEDEALVTSMNLYEYSQVNNYEMGISVSRENDPELYGKIKDESERILRACDPIRVTVDKVDPEQTVVQETPKEPAPTLGAPPKGFCIRCKTDLPIASPVRPYCGRCFASWNRFKNDDYEEKHCHACGNEHATSMAKPLCLACFRKYKDVLVLAAG